MTNNSDTDFKLFLEEVFDEIMNISNGKCSIEYDAILKFKKHQRQLDILTGLKLLHEDIELYKNEYRDKIKAEYKLKVLQQKNKELEQFNFMASHDLKEPLRTVQCFSSLLLTKYEQLSKEKINEYLSFINSAGLRMSNLISGLSEYSNIDTQLNKVKVDLDITLFLIIKNLNAVIEKTNAQIEIDALPNVYGDKFAIKRIFQNLIVNAIKFRDPQRNLQVKIEAKEMENEFIFSIKDNGLGIEDKYKDRIFELLKRLHVKSKIEGSGIGLSICKKLVEVHGGKIWIDSEIGKGSIFYFSLPKI